MLDAILVVLAGASASLIAIICARIVPFVDRAGDIEALVALEADQLAVERGGENLRDLGLADAGLALEEQRPSQPEAEENDGRERPIADIRGPAEQGSGFRRSRPEGPPFARTKQTPRQNPRRACKNGSDRVKPGRDRLEVLPLPLARQARTRKAARNETARGAQAALEIEPRGAYRASSSGSYGRAASARGRGHEARPSSIQM